MKTEDIVFSVERITFYNNDNGYAVLRCINKKVSRDLITVVGSVTNVYEGSIIECKGSWINDLKYGKQFKASSVEVKLPSTEKGIEKYLGSEMIRGIGKHFAEKIVKKFGDQVFSIIEESPQRLKEIKGISEKRVDEITKSWKEHKSINDIMIFLQGLGIGVLNATRIYNLLGKEAVSIIKKDPYQLVHLISGLGFVTVDKIALEAGLPRDSEKRIKAAINYMLMSCSSEGHCGLPKKILTGKVSELIDVSLDEVESVLNKELESAEIIEDSIEIEGKSEKVVFNKFLYSQEKTIAGKLKSILFQFASLYNYDHEKVIPELEKKIGIKLADKQKLALFFSMKCNMLVITGGPGTGKTTILKSIIELHKKHSNQIYLCAPTGRAAKRLSESTGMKAFTIHRLLKIDPVSRRFTYNKENQLKCDVLIVDESSMIDIPLMWGLINAIDKKTQLILVGDSDQLPSVGPGRVLSEIIESQAFPVVKLDEIFRQAQESSIITNAYKVNKGEMPDLSNEKKDFIFIEADHSLDSQKKLVRIIKEKLPCAFNYNPKNDIQVLSPMQRGLFGVRSLNEVLQREINSNSRNMQMRVELFGNIFAEGDKVMQIENNYDKDVYNGDIGYIQHIDIVQKKIVIDFDNVPIVYQYDEMVQVLLAYATTIHKSQGSEYPVVVIPLYKEQHVMLQRNLLYTAITRGKERVVIFGERAALNKAVKTVVSNKRYTKLKEWMIANKNYI